MYLCGEAMEVLQQLLKTGMGFAADACHCSAETRVLEAEHEDPCEKQGAELYELTLEYRWAELSQATDRFSEALVLSRGHTGTVFRAQLEEGVPVAIKVLKGGTATGFTDEVRLLSRCHHPNVVMLLGYAIDGGGDFVRSPRGSGTEADREMGRRRALVYELLPGGSAFTRLQSGNYAWQHRLQTALQVSRGLAHLHKFQPEIFHRDIKSANILFTAEGVAKVADFGLACVSRGRTEQWSAVAVATGTPGYCAPEYARTNVVSEASEMYSMGMVLMELLTGRPPAIATPDGDGFQFLLAEVRPDLGGAEDRILSLLDPRAEWPEDIAERLADISLQAIHDVPIRRPHFIELVALLQPVSESARSRVTAVPVALPLHPQLQHNGSQPVGETPGAARPEEPKGPTEELHTGFTPTAAALLGAAASPAAVAFAATAGGSAVALSFAVPSRDDDLLADDSECTSGGYHGASENNSGAGGGPPAGPATSAPTAAAAAGTQLFRWLSQKFTRKDVDGDLDGAWAHKTCPNIVEVIKGDTIHGRDGTLTRIVARSRDTLSIELNGSLYCATLVGDHLFWDDGDIWVRVGDMDGDAPAVVVEVAASASSPEHSEPERTVSRSSPDHAEATDPLLAHCRDSVDGPEGARTCRDVAGIGAAERGAQRVSDALGLVGVERYHKLHHISEIVF